MPEISYYFKKYVVFYYSPKNNRRVWDGKLNITFRIFLHEAPDMSSASDDIQVCETVCLVHFTHCYPGKIKPSLHFMALHGL